MILFVEKVRFDDFAFKTKEGAPEPAPGALDAEVLEGHP